MIGGCDGRPVENSTGPGTPTPTAHTSAGVRPASASTFCASRSTSASTAPGPVGDVDRVADGGEDLRGQIGDRDVDAGDAEVDGEHAAGPAVELQQGRRPAAGAPPPAALLEEVGRDQLVDPGAHRVPRGTGQRHQVRAAARPAGAHVAQQHAGRGRGVRHGAIVTRGGTLPRSPVRWTTRVGTHRMAADGWLGGRWHRPVDRHRARYPMGLPITLSEIAPRISAGAFILNSGLGKRGADEQAAAGMHGFAAGTYPFLKNVPPQQFAKALSTSEIAIGASC